MCELTLNCPYECLLCLRHDQAGEVSHFSFLFSEACSLGMRLVEEKNVMLRIGCDRAGIIMVSYFYSKVSWHRFMMPNCALSIDSYTICLEVYCGSSPVVVLFSPSTDFSFPVQYLPSVKMVLWMWSGKWSNNGWPSVLFSCPIAYRFRVSAAFHWVFSPVASTH